MQFRIFFIYFTAKERKKPLPASVSFAHHTPYVGPLQAHHDPLTSAQVGPLPITAYSVQVGPLPTILLTSAQVGPLPTILPMSVQEGPLPTILPISVQVGSLPTSAYICSGGAPAHLCLGVLAAVRL